MSSFKTLLDTFGKNLIKPFFKKILNANSPQAAFDAYRDEDFPPQIRAKYNEDLIKAMGAHASNYFFMGAISQVVMMGKFYEDLEKVGRTKDVDAGQLATLVLETFAAMYLQQEQEFKIDCGASKAIVREIRAMSEGKPFLNPDLCNCPKCRQKKKEKDPASIFEDAMGKSEEPPTEKIPEELVKELFAKVMGMHPDDIKVFKLKPSDTPGEPPQEIKDLIDKGVDEFFKKEEEKLRKRSQAENN